MTNRNDNYSNNGIKANIYGLASTLLVATNANWNSDYIVVYAMPFKTAKADEDFKSLVFGRVCVDNAFKADKACIVNLNRFYSNKLIDFVISIDKLESIANEHNCNFGYAMEIALVQSGMFKKASAKYDRKGVDLIGTNDRKLYQLKTSVVKPNSHGSAGTTNKKAHK
jgi:hypothetical protein